MGVLGVLYDVRVFRKLNVNDYLVAVSVWEKIPVYLIILINVATVGIGVYGYFINNLRVKKEITPRIDRVNELINKLEQ